MCVVALATICAAFIACGGGDDAGGGGGGSNGSDASISSDANSSVDTPGSGSAVTGLGQACTPPSTGSGQGDCPPGFTCLAIQGFTTPWCSKSCATGAGDMCATGYAGPGVAGCIEQITFNGGAAMTFCGITCSGDGVNGCTTTTCTGACPGQLMCNAVLMDSGGNAIGSACQ